MVNSSNSVLNSISKDVEETLSSNHKPAGSPTGTMMATAHAFMHKMSAAVSPTPISPTSNKSMEDILPSDGTAKGQGEAMKNDSIVPNKSSSEAHDKEGVAVSIRVGSEVEVENKIATDNAANDMLLSLHAMIRRTGRLLVVSSFMYVGFIIFSVMISLSYYNDGSCDRCYISCILL